MRDSGADLPRVAVAVGLSLQTPFLRALGWRYPVSSPARFLLVEIWLLGLASSLMAISLYQSSPGRSRRARPSTPVSASPSPVSCPPPQLSYRPGGRFVLRSGGC